MMWQETFVVTFFLFLAIAFICRPKTEIKEQGISRLQFEELTSLINRIQEITKKDHKLLNRFLIKHYREEFYKNG